MLEKEDYENDKPIEVAYDEFSKKYRNFLMLQTLQL